MGGKSSQSTQTVSIPPEVLARYNAVNARAETTAQTPFQQYSTDASAFVAPLTATQQAGIQGANQYAGAAQPYYGAATQQLMGAQSRAQPYYQMATNNVTQGQGVGAQYADASTRALANAQGVGTALAGTALGGLSSALQGAQPYNRLATGYLMGGAQAVNPQDLGAEQINKYMSPYLGNVLQGTAALQNQMNQQAMSGQLGNAIRAGAFGGDRAGIAAANLAQQQQLANAKIFSDILNQGYGQALGTAQQQQQLGLSAEQANRAALQQAAQQSLGIGQQIYGQGTGTAQQQAAIGQQLFGQGATAAQQLAGLGQQQFGQNLAAAQQMQALGQGLYGMGSSTSQQLAGLGAGAQAAGLQGAQAQLAAGQAQQQTEQAGLQALYNQFLQKQSYPFQVAQFLANIAMGTGALSGSTTQTNQAMGGFSDRRLKENIREVGKTFDGQTIYSYNFKGSPKTEIGLMAQEVEKKHPKAVGLAGGYKTVRYDKATDEAADRGHFAYGGSAMGGGVMPQHAGEGFYDGGFVGFDPGLMQQILASYQQMYAPISSAPASGGLGAASFVPAGNLPVGSLQTAGDLPSMPSAFENAQSAVSLGQGIGELGDKVGAWKWGDKQEEQDDREDTPDILKGIYQRGGRAGLAGGGVPTELSIPDEKEKIEPLKPADPPEPLKDSTADLIKTAAKIAMMAAANGGRIGYADGGMPYGAGTGYLSGVLEEQNKQKTPELLTAGSLPGQGPGLLDKAAKGVGLVSGLMNIGSKLGFATGGEVEESLNPEILSGLKRGLDPMNYVRDVMAMEPDAEQDFEGLAPAPNFEQPRRIEMARPQAGLVPVQQPKTASPSRIIPTSGGIRSVRNNNPGNIEDGSFAQKLPGYVGSDGRFAVFDNPQVGRAAQIALIQSYIRRGHDTPLEIANRWAPGKEKGNDPMRYAKTIARNLGIDVNDRVSSSAAPKIADAQTFVEGGPKALKHFAVEFSRGGYADGGAGGLLPASIQDEIDRENNMSDLDMPDRVPEPRATGVAPAVAAPPPAPTPMAEQSAPQKGRGLLSNIGKGEFVSGLGKGKATSWIPLLTGLATFGTTPTRSMVSGALAGLGAGAQAAQAQREFARQQQETGIRGFGAETARMQIPIAQQVANVQRLNALRTLRDNAKTTMTILEATGQNVPSNPAYQRAVAEFNRVSDQISAMENLGIPAATGSASFLGKVNLSDPSQAQRLAFGLGVAGAPGAEIPANIAAAARDTGKVLTEGGVQAVPGFAGTTANLAATVQGAEGATAANREAYEAAQNNWHRIQTDVLPVLRQIPAELPETGLTGSALSNLASAVRVLASTQGYDASGINGDDPRSVITAAGEMLGVPVSADRPTAAVKTIIEAMKRRVWQMSNAARAAGSWAKQNTDPVTGRPDFSRGNVTAEITKAMGQ